MKPARALARLRCWRMATKSGSPTRSCTGLITRVPGECIADNALGAWKWSARDDLHVQGCLILSQVGLLFPANHAPMKMASLTGFAPVISCMRGRHVGWTTPQGQTLNLAELNLRSVRFRLFKRWV